MIIIGERIKELRKKSKYTQTELADLLGVTKSTIAAYENDTRLPSYEVLIKMARVFKLPTDSLLLNRSGTILDIDGLNRDQIEIVERLVMHFRKYNLMESYIEKSIEDQKKYGKKVIQFNDFVNDPSIFDE